MGGLADSDVYQRYVQSTDKPKLHLGAGQIFLRGWLNTDISPLTEEIFKLDMRELLPFPDASFDYIFGEHVIEHVSLREGTRLLMECARILRPNGRIRLATPNLEVLLELFAAKKQKEQIDYIKWATHKWVPDAGVYHPTIVLNNMMRNWGHVFVYTKDLLAHNMVKAGFSQVTLFKVGVSSDPVLCNIENHGKVVGEIPTAFETMVLEGRR